MTRRRRHYVSAEWWRGHGWIGNGHVHPLLPDDDPEIDTEIQKYG